MTPQQARDIAQILINAADRAEESGADKVEILSDLRSMDDEARAELDAAIKTAKEQE